MKLVNTNKAHILDCFSYCLHFVELDNTIHTYKNVRITVNDEIEKSNVK